MAVLRRRSCCLSLLIPLASLGAAHVRRARSRGVLVQALPLGARARGGCCRGCGGGSGRRGGGGALRATALESTLLVLGHWLSLRRDDCRWRSAGCRCCCRRG